MTIYIPFILFKSNQVLSESINQEFLLFLKLGDSWDYMPPTLVPSSAKRMATQILVTAKLNGRKYFTLRVFVCDIIHKELPVQS